jgi:signal transduction histidine kinase
MVMNLRLAAEANQERERLRAELVEMVIDAQEAERKRIACDLHDQTSQALVSLIVQLKLIEKAQNDSTRGKNIEIFRDQLRIALEDVRQMALDLRPNVLDDLGLEQAIHWFADRCSQNNGLKVSVRTSGDFRDLPERYLVTIYRVIQESLSNVVKHSHAQSTLVELIREPDLIYVKVADDGKGFKVNNPYGKKDSLGILGMKERISLLGGQFELQSKPGNGVTISASIPIELSYQQNKTQCEESR